MYGKGLINRNGKANQKWSLSDILYELVEYDNAEEKDFWK